ncbi:MAG: AraC family transcriptional regulator [Haliangiales bacterium]
MPEQRRIHAQTIWLQYQTSRDYGIDEAELAAIGLRGDALIAPDAMVPAELVYRHLELVASRVEIESFVVALARAHSVSSMGVLGFAIKSAASVRAALSRLRRYQHLTNTLAAFDVLEHTPRAVLVEQRFGPVSLGQLLATEVSLLTTVQIWRGLLGDEIAPSALYVRRDDVDTGPYQDFCRCPIYVGAERGRFEFDASWLDLPIASADADMAVYFDHTLDKMAQSSQQQPELVTAVRQVLARALPDGLPAVREVASAVGMSVRTLQRRLKAEGSSFASVVDQVRVDLATAYLENRALTISEVAYLLGYAEASSFSRAFRRWHGDSPEGYRQRAG